MNQKKSTLRTSFASLALMLVMLFSISITAYADGGVTGLAQTDASKTSIDVAWNADVNASGYRVYISTDNVNFTRVGTSSGTDTSSPKKSIFDLSPGCSYFVKVAPVSGKGTTSSPYVEGVASASIEVVTKPDATSVINFTGADDTTATIEWAPVTGATSYVVTYNNQQIPVAATSYAVPMVSGVSYASVAAARTSSAGYTAVGYSESKSGLKTMTTKIAKDNFGLSSAYSTSASIAVANYSGSGFEVKGYNLKTGKKAFTKTATTYASVTIKTNIMYKYRVRAYVDTDAGRKYGSWSSYRYFVNPKKCQYTTSGKKIKLSWSKMTGVSKIKVQISTKENSGYKTCATLSGTKTSYTISKYGKSALKKGKKYYVKIIYYAKNGKKTYTSDYINGGSVTVR